MKEVNNEKNSENENIRLHDLNLPEDIKKLTINQCKHLCKEIRQILISTVSKTGGHLSSNLGVVELTMAIHRCFNSPEDKIVWDVGHQTYTHKILTGRLDKFSTLRQENGISGFPKPCESKHDSFIIGHSSTSISVACGMAYEGLNNSGKSKSENLIVILNDNNMSISKNVGALAKYLTSIRGTEKYLHTKRAIEKTLINIPVIGMPVAKGIKNSKDAVRGRILQQSTLFEDMGFVYLGPVNGHSLTELEQVINTAKSYDMPVFIHVITVKGKGYLPAEKNPGEYHGISKFDIITGNPEVSVDECYSTVFGKELVELAEKDGNICAVTAAMKYGTGLQFFYDRFKERFFDVGIAEQHAVTFSAGLASMGMIPVFAVYSSFIQRAYDQLIHDVAISGMHVVLGIDRAGIVGEDGETHQGMFDVPMLTSIPNTAIYSPSCYAELKMGLKKALYDEKGLAAVRYPRGQDNSTFDKSHLNTEYTFTEIQNSDMLLITYGRIYDELYKAQSILNGDGIFCDLLKLTKIFPIEKEVIKRALKYKKIIFFEESFGFGGISEIFSSLLMENGFTGSYSRVTANGFIKQASAASCLDKIGLSLDKMLEYVRKRSFD